MQVLLTPNSDWGGEGSLGCGIGYGYLHRIPAHKGSQQTRDLEMGEGAKEPPTAPPPSDGYDEVRIYGFSPDDACELTLFPLSRSPFQVPLSVPSQPGTPGQDTQTTSVSLSTLETGVDALSLHNTGTSGGDPHQVAPPTLPNTLVPAPVTIVRTSSPANQKHSLEHPPRAELGPHTQTDSVSLQPSAQLIQHDRQPYTQTLPFAPVAMTTSSSLANQLAPTQGASVNVPVHQTLSLQPNVSPQGVMAAQAISLPPAFSTTQPTHLPGTMPTLQATPTVHTTPLISAPVTTGAAPLSGLPTVPPTISFPSVAPTISLGSAPFLPPAANTNTTQ